ncbi:transposable element Tcb1 transposase [Trichonephila clavipes]|nr:transposable element Tcb1 transposase [Trichonephila clavipes]
MLSLTWKRVSQDCLLTVTTLPWPLRSPLSPIEHIWDHLGGRVGHPTTLNELEARLQQIWNEMSQDIIQNFTITKTKLSGTKLMMAKAYRAQLSIRTLGPEVREQMFRSGGLTDVKPPVLSSQASLVLIYQPTEEMQG